MDVREKLVELPIEDALLILREEHRQRTDSYTTYLAHGGKGDPAEEVGLDALAMAISALKQQQEQESNEPLTLDELRQMKGKPVWAIDGTGTAAYILIDADGNGIDTDSGFWDADYYGMTKDGKHGLHRMGWLAYRHQLKNTTEG